MRVSDYYAQYLKNSGVDYVFGLQGSGTTVQMFDSIAQCDGIDYVCTLHEEAAGMAACAYAQVTNGLGACIATSGPGATNLYTSIAGAFYNSIPVIFIVGQAQSKWLRYSDELRHFGYHENNIDIFKPITKYVVELTTPEMTCYEIEKAVYYAMEGRPGPVVISLVDDVTWLQIEPEKMCHFKRPLSDNKTVNNIGEILEQIKQAERPILMLGNGIRCAGAEKEAKELIELLKWPVALTYAMRDFLPDDRTENIGSFGNQGSRGGNFAVQNADFILAIGVRFDPYETGTPASNFARGAKIVSVDIDQAELEKYDKYDIRCDGAIRCDAKEFLKEFNPIVSEMQLASPDNWRNRIAEWKKKYPLCLPEYYHESTLNPYVFVEILSEELQAGDTIVTDTSTPRNFMYQAFKFKEKQRMVTWLNFACLGYGLPGAIGASYSGRGRVFGIMGDGGLQFNIQELATVMFNKLNIKIIVFDNGGFSTIYRSQEQFLEGRYYGSDREHGLPIPDCETIAKAYGLPIIRITSNDDIRKGIQEMLKIEGPVFCIVTLSIKHGPKPVRKGKDPIEDATPKLDYEELEKEMIIPPLKRMEGH